MPYAFDPDSLDRLANQHSADFTQALPYPYVVMDNFLRPEVAMQLGAEFPQPSDLAWDHYAAPGLEVKLGSSREESFPAMHRQTIHDLNTGVFVRFLERISGIDHLLVDPHLAGAGLHLTRAGGLLGIHSDFNWHEKLQAHRRLNLLLYLTPDWKPEYAGELQLWDKQAQAMQRQIEPRFNRAVLFTTRSDTFHGHPDPWSAPEGVNRQSIAMYYYTTTRPDDELRAPHNTLYKGVSI